MLIDIVIAALSIISGSNKIRGVLTEDNILIFIIFAVLVSLLNTIHTKMTGEKPTIRGWALILLPCIYGIKGIFKYGLTSYLLFVLIYSLIIRYIFVKYKKPSVELIEKSTSLTGFFLFFFLGGMLIFGVYYFVK